jgi:predicted nucleic acid-binding protein
MRIGEIRHLQWGDIDVSSLRILVLAKDGWTPKPHQERECYVSGEVIEQLLLYRKGRLTHEIRRAVASTMLLNGTPIHVVKEIPVHSTIKTTELYAFSNEEAKREASKNALIEATLGTVPLTRPVLQRASLPTPTSVRTLDALYVASALLLRERRSLSLAFATHDRQQHLAARALGFECIGL